ncbi:hypothetical protein FRACA_1800013 [Frankia canadensis]|uniref:Uncharacterized protein n=1 Tax=Frankia canadensis TaxID=1836972 RepID=A0A2I2KNQ8_9ACTN|nr:hypothetical protein FRACA_1800013 [Frankia canadensis]SOU54593.1 hypothetical protein FRACA_1800013 [Frankia canadensis]
MVQPPRGQRRPGGVAHAETPAVRTHPYPQFSSVGRGYPQLVMVGQVRPGRERSDPRNLRRRATSGPWPGDRLSSGQAFS